jgi:pimeloyl-ACP methyl ester carboxylesterase
MAEDIIELLNFLKIDSVILVGHSMGGGIAGYLSAVYPKYIKAVAILDKSASGPNIRNTLPLAEITDVDPLTKNWPLPFSSLNEAMNFIKQVASSNLEYQYFMNSLVETVEGYNMMFSSQAMAAYNTYYKSWFELLPNIKCLVLLIRAKGNDAVSDEDFIKMQSLISDCITREMSHSDHNVHLANKEEFYKYFDEFLKRI